MPVARAGETGTLDFDPSPRHSLGEDPVPSPGHLKSGVPSDVKSIPGWGVDLDRARRNVFPMQLPSVVRTARGDVKNWQVAGSTIDISNEQPGLTPVFGDTLPPRGLSGLIRNYAYEYGEGTSRHWMGLMFADRVERVERLVTDALQGKPDNILAERAWVTKFTAPGEHAQRSRATAGAAAALAAVGIGLLMMSRGRSR